MSVCSDINSIQQEDAIVSSDVLRFAEFDQRIAAIRARDRAADGHFWYGVRTTRIFCRPSCVSRPARIENISVHDSIASARLAGFRACKRCKPEG